MKRRTRQSFTPVEQQRGFTLIEILVALGIFGLVIAQAFAVFGAQHRTYTGTERAIEVQEDARVIADAILSDIRMAGYMVPKQVGIMSVDGGANAPDQICISDYEIIDDAKASAATARFDRATNTAPVNGGNPSINLVGTEMDIDQDGDSDFTIGKGIIIAEGTDLHCALVQNIGGASLDVINFTPAIPNGVGFNIPAGAARAVPAIIYRVTAGRNLMRNGRRLATQVEDLQIEFGIDADADGQIAEAEFLDSMQGSDPLDLLAVRLTLIARADQEDESITSSGRPAAANRVAGAADSFRRRRVTTTIMPRNLL